MKRRWLWMFAAVLLVAVLGSGCSPRDGEIHEAVESGDIARVQELLAATPGLVNARGATRQTPLHVAAFEGQSEIAELLVARGADVDAKSWTGETPLARAALFVRMEIAELLLENGADVNARNVTGMTPLHWAVYLGFQDDDVIELLLEAGADVNAKTKEGQTPVDLAGELGNEEVVELLKKPGAKE